MSPKLETPLISHGK